MNFRQLEAFRTTMRHMNVTAAAKSLNVSQPGVSRLLAELEYTIGIKLFHHRKGKLNPTREAELFYDEVDRSFVALESLRRTAELIRNGSYGHLRIGGVAALSMNVYPSAVADFRQSHPRTFLSIRVRSSRWIAQWISEHQLDIGILSSFFDFPAITVIRRYLTHLVLVVPGTHPLAEKNQITSQDLENQPFIGVDLPWMFRRCKDDDLREVVDRCCHIETGTFLDAACLIHQGAGISILDVFTSDYYRRFGLVAIPLDAEIPYGISIIHAAQKPPSLLAQAFLPELYRRIEAIGQSAPYFKVIHP